MLDFSGNAPPKREPAFNIPFVVLALALVLLAIHAFLGFGARDPGMIYVDWGFIPGRLTIGLFPQRLNELLESSNYDPQALAFARALRDSGVLQHGSRLWTLATYAFLHGSWSHVGVNCIWLVAFGPPIARRFGGIGFLLFFLTTAIGGAIAHWAFSQLDFFPMIGASAADSGMMAGAARFLFQPGGLVSAGGVTAALGGAGALGRPATLRELFTDRRALIFIFIWMATNFIFGAGAEVLGASEAPVAWIAHVGGFVTGLLLFPLFDRSPLHA